MTFSIEDALDRAVEADHEERQPDGKWHPSSLSGCDRRAIYGVRGVPKTNPVGPRTKRIFRLGDLIHEDIQTAVAAHPDVEQAFSEVPIEIPFLNVTGHADQVALLKGGRWVLLEYKSINSNAFRYKDLPKEDHREQIVPYLMALRTIGSADGVIPPLGDALSMARIAYVSKDDLLIGEYVIHHSPGREKELMNKLLRLEAYKAQPELLPSRLPKGPKGKHFLCGYCEWADRCWDQDEENEMRNG